MTGYDDAVFSVSCPTRPTSAGSSRCSARSTRTGASSCSTPRSTGSHAHRHRTRARSRPWSRTTSSTSTRASERTSPPASTARASPSAASSSRFGLLRRELPRARRGRGRRRRTVYLASGAYFPGGRSARPALRRPALDNGIYVVFAASSARPRLHRRLRDLRPDGEPDREHGRRARDRGSGPRSGHRRPCESAQVGQPARGPRLTHRARAGLARRAGRGLAEVVVWRGPAEGPPSDGALPMRGEQRSVPSRSVRPAPRPAQAPRPHRGSEHRVAQVLAQDQQVLGVLVDVVVLAREPEEELDRVDRLRGERGGAGVEEIPRAEQCPLPQAVLGPEALHEGRGRQPTRRRQRRERQPSLAQ